MLGQLGGTQASSPSSRTPAWIPPWPFFLSDLSGLWLFSSDIEHRRGRWLAAPAMVSCLGPQIAVSKQTKAFFKQPSLIPSMARPHPSAGSRIWAFLGGVGSGVAVGCFRQEITSKACPLGATANCYLTGGKLSCLPACQWWLATWRGLSRPYRLGDAVQKQLRAASISHAPIAVLGVAAVVAVGVCSWHTL